jgi:hypothetical protein
MFYYNLTRMMGTLYKDVCTFVIISLSIILRMRNVSDRIFRGNQSAHSVLSKIFFSKVLTFVR